MKTSILRIALGLCILAACAPPATQKAAEEDNAAHTPPEALLVAGESAGKFHLGQDMDSVFSLLGKPDDGDAAMGKAWGIWHGQDTLAVYSTYADSTMSRRTARQIVVSGEGYRTENGLGSNTPLETIRESYPALQPAATYVSDPGGDTLWVYDAEASGIAFDFRKKDGQLLCTAVTIHPADEPVAATYLTIHAGWKKLP
ncbi:hypothetical protein [Chitinophaga barathri]|uniref:Lipoprotein n=1 Tax=Chitinophaga barathri TaxID=1647451 RepID=A0A3N4MI58_9BACT|nr:hypothetical protein [Chitinophaga barathri]RPD41736.1 hypothetical protein EG028_06090 [Chitinophaga barathri]